MRCPVLNQILVVFPTKLFFTKNRAEMPGFPLYQQFWRSLDKKWLAVRRHKKSPALEGAGVFLCLMFSVANAPCLFGDRSELNKFNPDRYAVLGAFSPKKLRHRAVLRHLFSRDSSRKRFLAKPRVFVPVR